MSGDSDEDFKDPLLERLFAEAEACLDKRGRGSNGDVRKNSSLEMHEVPRVRTKMTDPDTDQLSKTIEEVEKLKGRVAAQKKRYERDLEIALTKQRDKMLRDFLALLDDLERAMVTEPPAGIDKGAFAGYNEGVQRVFEGGISTLKHYGVVPFDSLGEIFDPERHEAMRRESHGDYDVNHVCAVFQTGYLVGDRLLRAARVSVSSGPST